MVIDCRNHSLFFIGKSVETLVEHPLGTMERQWRINYILTKKGMDWASSDIGFMFIAYDLRRIVNILTKNRLKEYLRILLSLFLTISDLIRDHLTQSSGHIYNPSLKLV
jgi:hypothetical protein